MRPSPIAAFVIAAATTHAAADPTPPGTTYARGRVLIPGAEDVVHVAAGSFHVLLVTSEADLIACGDNFSYQLPNAEHFRDVEHVAAGRMHSLMRARFESSNPFLSAFGDDSFDQISYPLEYRTRHLLALGAGRAHSVALFTDHTVAAWGDDTYDQDHVPPNLPPVVTIATGDDHNLAVLQDQTVVGWGKNGSGQCDPPPGLAGVTSVAAGADHSLARFAVGSPQPNVVAWGDNTQGQCDVPPEVVLATAIAAGAHHSMALLSDGTVVCWGANNWGQCDVPQGLSGVVAIDAGDRASYAVLDDGTLVAWGLVPFACDGDLNGDNATDVFDFAEFLLSFGNEGGRAQGDLNADGAVNVLDFTILAGDFGCLIEGDTE